MQLIITRNSIISNLITRKNYLRVFVLLGVVILIITAFYIHNLKKNKFMPTQLNEKPIFLYELHGNGLDIPMGVAVDNHDHLYVSDPGSHRIKVFNTNGTPNETLGKPGTGRGQLNYPYGLAINSAGNLLVADSANRRILVYSTKGKFLKELVPTKNRIGLVRPGAITVDRSKIYISDLWGHQVLVVDCDGNLIRKIGSPGSKNGQFKFPQSVVIDAKQRIWVADTGNNRIQVFDKEGKFLFKISGKENRLNPSLLRGMVIDSLHRIFVSDAVNNRILVYDSKGNSLFSFGELGTQKQQFMFPMNLWIAKDGRIYIADRGNRRVQVWGYKGR